MDWLKEVLSPALPIITQIVLELVVTALAVVIGWAIRWGVKEIKGRISEQQARILVQYLEQMKKNTGEESYRLKEIALAQLPIILERYGIEMSHDEIDRLIEAAVNGLNTEVQPKE